jgi:methylmalonyl-CoA mutase cobalamin-binding subunit
VDLDPKLGELTRVVARERFDVVGFSISADRYVGRLHEAMSAVRRANPAALVVVGGSLFAERPELADELRPDFVAADAESASRAMTSILDTAGRSAT